ncbi:hypothetical protein MSG37_06115 [Shewanella sp. 1CM18E]|uniref:hypothetical protein n=1 Tax=Shewanella sp. 1CM18E TaxID=2929169 RepID=UPI0020C084EB|nr:hypothetical protein [Shewanella sp. 1CM18E]MCK8044452.1 hypothetical protein [Shewanella sp. 1CM18E]
MGTKRLTQGFTLSTLFVCLSASALELDKSQPSLALVEQGCAYGRGALAIEAAKAQALNNLRLFLLGETSFSFSTDDSQLFDEQYNQQNRELLVSGITQGTIRANYDQPEIQGDDTCITVRLTPPTAQAQESEQDVVWDSEPTMSVVVVGEGKSKAGLTARQAAEQDAFQRAVSQVLGVMVKSGFMQQSSSNMSASANSDDFNMQEVATQSLSLQTQGLISHWNEVSSLQLPDGTLTVTLDITVEKKRIEEKVAELITSLGQPTVYIDAKLPIVKQTFTDALASMGFNLSESPAAASIILQVLENEKITPSGLQLELRASVVDRAGNQYGVWRNDPTFLTLPNQPDMLNELASVHLALEDNQQALKQQLHDSVHKMAMRGGPVRELILSEKAAGKHGQLYTLLSAINGVSDIKINAESGRVIVQLRSLNNANDLAQYIEPSLRIHQPQYQTKLSVLNEYQIQVL